MNIVRGAILIPKSDGAVQFVRDGAIAAGSNGQIEWIGEFERFPGRERADVRRADGLICPAFLDNHIHIPQHPIRGHFMDGIGATPEGGRLIAGLNRNVFPAEAKCAHGEYTRQCVADFLRDTLAHGVIGGAAYMTVHAEAARIALEMLPPTWSLGLVMMNQNCPTYLRNDESNFERDAEALARDFGHRYIVTDRFAVACDTRLRRRGVAIAKHFDLRLQTHLNEQLQEKAFVENTLYPGESYAGVYHRDGLLDRPGAILAHCIHMSDTELDVLVETKAVVAHCPTSNTLLGSGIMPLDAIVARGIDYAICTDVGASPTTSLLNEMAQYLVVHAGRSKRATPAEALFRTTLAPARMMNLGARVGSLEMGAPMSFAEVECDAAALERCGSADDAIRLMVGLAEVAHDPRADLKQALDLLAAGRADAGPHIDRLTAEVNESVRRLDDRVLRVVIEGRTQFERRAR